MEAVDSRRRSKEGERRDMGRGGRNSETEEQGDGDVFDGCGRGKA